MYPLPRREVALRAFALLFSHLLFPFGQHLFHPLKCVSGVFNTLLLARNSFLDHLVVHHRHPHPALPAPRLVREAVEPHLRVGKFGETAKLGNDYGSRLGGDPKASALVRDYASSCVVVKLPDSLNLTNTIHELAELPVAADFECKPVSVNVEEAEGREVGLLVVVVLVRIFIRILILVIIVILVVVFILVLLPLVVYFFVVIAFVVFVLLLLLFFLNRLASDSRAFRLDSFCVGYWPAVSERMPSGTRGGCVRLSFHAVDNLRAACEEMAVLALRGPPILVRNVKQYESGETCAQGEPLSWPPSPPSQLAKGRARRRR
mmetsp:Transcript_16241/g.40013  ORF Transcript_16241/g.40013 Transcript_16241/m.40013 type:complete len:319 (-) Transcript_16241:276-1232(-)